MWVGGGTYGWSLKQTDFYLLALLHIKKRKVNLVDEVCTVGTTCVISLGMPYASAIDQRGGNVLPDIAAYSLHLLMENAYWRTKLVIVEDLWS